MQEPALSCPMPQKKKVKNDDDAATINSTNKMDASTSEEIKKTA